MPDDKSNGEGWLIRTYSDIQELEEIEKPNADFPIKQFQLKPEILDNDFPCWEDCPIEVPQEFDEEEFKYTLQGKDTIPLQFVGLE